MIWLLFLLLALLPCSAQQNSFADLAFMASGSACPFNNTMWWTGDADPSWDSAAGPDTGTLAYFNCSVDGSTVFSLTFNSVNGMAVSNMVSLTALTNLAIDFCSISADSGVENHSLSNVWRLMAISYTGNGGVEKNPGDFTAMTNLESLQINDTGLFLKIDGCVRLTNLSIEGTSSDSQTTYYLTNLDVMGASNGTINLNGAVPTSEGMTASNNLVVKGWTVNP